MYIVRDICVVQYGKFREFAELAQQLIAVCEAKGWAKPRLLVPTVGLNNEAVYEVEYPDLATFEAENRAQLTDPDFMGPFRASAEYIYPQTSRMEIYEDVFSIA